MNVINAILRQEDHACDVAIGHRWVAYDMTLAYSVDVIIILANAILVQFIAKFGLCDKTSSVRLSVVVCDRSGSL